MLKFFRRIRRKLLEKKKFNQYLLYAGGEILLVVAGILIALQVNIWNEAKKRENEKEEIFKIIVANIEADLPKVETLIQTIEWKIRLIDSVTNDLIPQEKLETCWQCLTANLFEYQLTINTEGNEMLKTILNQEGAAQDSLAHEVVAFYKFFEERLNISLDLMREDIKSTLLLQRDHIENMDDLRKFYQSVDTRNFTRETGRAVLQSKDFMRRMMFHRNMLQLNPLPILKRYNRRAKRIKRKIEERLIL